ncbi:MAG: hypothetical protein WC178_05025 [Candidatus Paceibacterota bacterium]
MKSLERNFIKITERNPPWSSYICFAVAVTKRKFQRSVISRWFYKLVEKDDYERKDKKGLLAHLHDLSNPAEDDKNQGQNDII